MTFGEIKKMIEPKLTEALANEWFDQNDSLLFIEEAIFAPNDDIKFGINDPVGEYIAEWIETRLTRILPPLLGDLAKYRLSRRDSAAL